MVSVSLAVQQLIGLVAVGQLHSKWLKGGGKMAGSLGLGVRSRVTCLPNSCVFACAPRQMGKSPKLFRIFRLFFGVLYHRAELNVDVFRFSWA